MFFLCCFSTPHSGLLSVSKSSPALILSRLVGSCFPLFLLSFSFCFSFPSLSSSSAFNLPFLSWQHSHYRLSDPRRTRSNPNHWATSPGPLKRLNTYSKARLFFLSPLPSPERRYRHTHTRIQADRQTHRHIVACGVRDSSSEIIPTGYIASTHVDGNGYQKSVVFPSFLPVVALLREGKEGGRGTTVYHLRHANILLRDCCMYYYAALLLPVCFSLFLFLSLSPLRAMGEKTRLIHCQRSSNQTTTKQRTPTPTHGLPFVGIEVSSTLSFSPARELREAPRW